MVSNKEKVNKKPSVHDEIHLPQEIIVDILSRVPIEDLLRYRCVSKQWCDMIFDPFFVNLHSQRVSTDLGFMYYEPPNLFYNNNAKDEKREGWFKLENDLSTDDVIVVIYYSCNGLLLMSCADLKDTRSFYVYNPITHKSVMVPSFISTFSNGNILHSLVYDSVSEKYKVVSCGYSTTDGYTSKIITVGVEGDTWRDVIIPKPHRLCEYPPIFANGSLHLMMDSVDLENLEASFFLEPESLGKVLTMDVGREIFYTIPHPECNSGVYTLVEMEGLLCFVDHISNTQLQIWVLKDLELHEWNVKYRIDISHLKKVPFKGFLEDSFPFAITTTLKCKIIIKYYDSVNHLTQFFSYDMDRKQLDEERGLDSAWTQDLSEFEQKFYPLKHVNTLVSF